MLSASCHLFYTGSYSKNRIQLFTSGQELFLVTIHSCIMHASHNPGAGTQTSVDIKKTCSHVYCTLNTSTLRLHSIISHLIQFWTPLREFIPETVFRDLVNFSPLSDAHPLLRSISYDIPPWLVRRRGVAIDVRSHDLGCPL